MDRALFGDEPLRVCKLICCLLFFNLWILLFFRGVAKRLSLCMLLGQCVRGCWRPSGKYVTGDQKVLATLWQIFYRVSEGNGNTLETHRFCPEGIDLPSRSDAGGYWIISGDPCKRVAPLARKTKPFLQ
jgi:hypothetical protein